MDICIDSQDPLIFHASDVRVRQSMDIAMRLGVHAVIFHTNHIANFRLKSYREDWLKKNSAYWRRLLAEYPALTVYLENMFDEEPDLLRRLAEDLSDEPRFGVCYDMAHAYLSQTPLTDWNQALLPYVCHLHINVGEFLKLSNKFKHLRDEDIAFIQEEVNSRMELIKKLAL